jgi:hypothetical protein
MRELGHLLAKREMTISFDHLNNRVRCYAHIINICSSHVISDFSSSSFALDPDSASRDDNDDDDDDDGSDDGPQEPKVDDPLADQAKEWAEGIKRDPLRRCRQIIRLFRSSDEHRTGFRKFIDNGNQHDWFTRRVDGKRVAEEVPQLQLLRDVKTRWDSVYMMIRRLRELRLVSHLVHWIVEND